MKNDLQKIKEQLELLAFEVDKFIPIDFGKYWIEVNKDARKVIHNRVDELKKVIEGIELDEKENIDWHKNFLK